MSEVYDCDHCGLCCQRLIIEADVVDVLREPRVAEHWHRMDAHGQLPILDTVWSCVGVCPFHAEDRCSIHATRPRECVSFIAGSAKCQDLREAAGLPRLMPRRMDTACVADAINAAALPLEGGLHEGCEDD